MAREQIQVIVPTDWKDITIAEYQRYLQLAKTRRKTKDDEIIAMFCKVDKELIKKVKLKDKKVLVDKINKFVNSKNERELEKRIKFKGKQYGFLPNLSKITTGEFVDIEEYGKDINANLHRIMSVLYRPVIAKEEDGTYAIEDYEPNEEVANLFKKELTLKEFNGASVFFYDLERELSIHSLKSLIKKKKMRNQTKEVVK